jgi:hypothetical protein
MACIVFLIIINDETVRTASTACKEGHKSHADPAAATAEGQIERI